MEQDLEYGQAAVSRSVRETERIGIRLASSLRPGDLVALRGGLGAGKTAFVRGVAEGMGLDPDEVSSPTFSLVNEYRGRVDGEDRLLCHFDLYRIADEEELYHTGFYDYLDAGAVLAVEWSERVEEALPPGRITVTITPDPDAETVRTIVVEREGGQA